MEIPEGFFNTRYRFECNGVSAQMGFSLGGQALPGVDAEEIAQQCAGAFFEAAIKNAGFVNDAYSWRGTQTTLTIGGQPQVGEFNSSIDGDGVGDGVIVNSALLVRKLTSQGGRKNRGRMFVPPYAENNADIDAAGFLVGTHLAAMQGVYDDFYVALGINGVPPWLLHSDPVDEPTPIAAFSVSNQLATQRRRMR